MGADGGARAASDYGEQGRSAGGDSFDAVHYGTFGRSGEARTRSGEWPPAPYGADRSAFAVEMDIGCGAYWRRGGGRCRGGRAGWKFGTRCSTASRYAAGGYHRQPNDFGGKTMKRLFILLSAVLSAQQAIDAPPLA